MAKNETLAFSYGRTDTTICSESNGYSRLCFNKESKASPPQVDLLLYLGSFDPPHLGHAAVIRHALKVICPRELHCVVLNRHCEGKDLSPAVHRIEMLRRFTKAIGRNVSVNTVDVDEGLSGCTADTISALRKRYPQKSLGVLLGTDHLATFPTWKDVKILTSSATCFFVPRPGTALPEDTHIPGTVVLPCMKKGKHTELSSLKIKRLIHKKEAKKIINFTFPSVARYVLGHRLYADFFERHPQLLIAAR